jgi:hypothetical protein
MYATISLTHKKNTFFIQREVHVSCIECYTVFIFLKPLDPLCRYTSSKLNIAFHSFFILKSSWSRSDQIIIFTSIFHILVTTTIKVKRYLI